MVHAVVAYGGLMCAHAVCGGWPIDPRPATLPDAPDDRRPAMMNLSLSLSLGLSLSLSLSLDLHTMHLSFRRAKSVT